MARVIARTVQSKGYRRRESFAAVPPPLLARTRSLPSLLFFSHLFRERSRAASPILPRYKRQISRKTRRGIFEELPLGTRKISFFFLPFFFSFFPLPLATFRLIIISGGSTIYSKRAERFSATRCSFTLCTTYAPAFSVSQWAHCDRGMNFYALARHAVR